MCVMVCYCENLATVRRDNCNVAVRLKPSRCHIGSNEILKQVVNWMTMIDPSVNCNVSQLSTCDLNTQDAQQNQL